jgi:hypothetical protein
VVDVFLYELYVHIHIQCTKYVCLKVLNLFRERIYIFNCITRVIHEHIIYSHLYKCVFISVNSLIVD